ncbi:MAG: hypothetical protein ACFB0C_20895 [Leptolyngbyaceae cyanobacterium]
MAEPLLSEVFGTNASQTPTQLIIDKGDLDLVASANNTAESLFVAVIKIALSNLTEASRSNDPENRNLAIIDAGDQIYSDSARNYKIRSLALQLFRDYNTEDINPGDF